MARAKKAVRREWTREDLKVLRSLAREKTPARAIGRKLKRTEGAVRQKAHAMSLSLRSRRKAAAKSR